MREAPAEAGASPGRRALRREWFRKHGGSLSGDDTPGKPRGGLGGASVYRPPRAGTEDGGPWKMVLAVLGRRYTLAIVEAPALAGPVALDTPRGRWKHGGMRGRERNRTHSASLRVSYPRPQAGNRGGAFFWRKSRDFCLWFWRAGRRGLRCGTFQGRQEGPPRGFSG